MRLKDKYVYFSGLMIVFILLGTLFVGCTQIITNCQCNKGTPPSYPLGRVKGKVTNLDTGSPITNASINLSGPSGSGSGSSTSPNGTYTSAFVPYDTYTMSVTAPNYYGTSSSVTVNAYQITKDWKLDHQ